MAWQGEARQGLAGHGKARKFEPSLCNGERVFYFLSFLRFMASVVSANPLSSE